MALIERLRGTIAENRHRENVEAEVAKNRADLDYILMLEDEDEDEMEDEE